MFLLGIAMLIVSIFGLIITTAIYVCFVGISKMLGQMVEVSKRNEERRAINISNKNSLKG